jgi:glycosyltransferase involved in cell wall biosynthesis
MDGIEGLVSILIPFYNSERFLSETIESVLAQTYTHWELLLVDDGSVDRSTEIARAYAAKSPDKIRYLEHAGHRNRGLTCTRNLGARNSHGEYLAFLDSDDVWLPQKLSEQVRAMEAHPEAGLVYGPSEFWYDWDVHRAPQQENDIPALATGDRLYLPPVLLTASYPFGKFGAPCPSSFFLRRTAFDQVKGFDESFNPNTHQIFEDTAFLSKIYLEIPVFVSGSCWDRYRCNPLSLWHSAKGTSREESARRFYFRWLRRYLREHHIADQDIWKAIRREAWMYSLPIPAFASKFLRRISNRLLR